MSRSFVPRILLGVFVLVLLASAVVTVRAVLAARDPSEDRVAVPTGHVRSAPREAALVADRDAARAAEVLRRWDDRRARAWAAGNADRLAGLYAAGSAAGRRDTAMLAAYRERGLTVRGLDTQLLAVEVLAGSSDRWRLRVTDRVVGGEVVDGEGARRPLPRDAASTRVVTLVRSADGWRVAEVVDRPAQDSDPSAAPTTAPTSRSRNR